MLLLRPAPSESIRSTGAASSGCLRQGLRGGSPGTHWAAGAARAAAAPDPQQGNISAPRRRHPAFRAQNSTEVSGRANQGRANGQPDQAKSADLLQLSIRRMQHFTLLDG
jgi:hypothetical protein